MTRKVETPAKPPLNPRRAAVESQPANPRQKSPSPPYEVGEGVSGGGGFGQGLSGACGERKPAKRPANKLRVKPGDVFGRLVAVSPEPSSERGYQCWKFRCACGAEFVARVANMAWRVRNGVCECVACYHARKAQAGDWVGR